jgi:hypothetical protein
MIIEEVVELTYKVRTKKGVKEYKFTPETHALRGSVDDGANENQKYYTFIASELPAKEES